MAKHLIRCNGYGTRGGNPQTCVQPMQRLQHTRRHLTKASELSLIDSTKTQPNLNIPIHQQGPSRLADSIGTIS